MFSAIASPLASARASQHRDYPRIDFPLTEGLSLAGQFEGVFTVDLPECLLTYAQPLSRIAPPD